VSAKDSDLRALREEIERLQVTVGSLRAAVDDAAALTALSLAERLGVLDPDEARRLLVRVHRGEAATIPRLVGELCSKRFFEEDDDGKHGANAERSTDLRVAVPSR